MGITSLPVSSSGSNIALRQTITSTGVLDFGTPTSFWFILVGGGGGGGWGEQALGSGGGGGAAGAVMGRAFGSKFYVTIGAGGAGGFNGGNQTNGGSSHLTRVGINKNTQASTIYSAWRSFNVTATGGGAGGGVGGTGNAPVGFTSAAAPSIANVGLNTNVVGDMGSAGGSGGGAASPTGGTWLNASNSTAYATGMYNGWTTNGLSTFDGTTVTHMFNNNYGPGNPFDNTSLTNNSTVNGVNFIKFFAGGASSNGVAQGGDGSGSGDSGKSGANGVFCGSGGGGGAIGTTRYSGAGGGNYFQEAVSGAVGLVNQGRGGSGGNGVLASGSVSSSNAGGAGGLGGGGGGGGAQEVGQYGTGGAGGAGCLLIFY